MRTDTTDEDRARGELPLAPHVLEILIALGEGPAHGYAIIKTIAEQSGGAVRLGTSTLYAALRKMAARGMVADAGRQADPSGGPPRKYYELTPFGRRVARLEALRLRDVSALAAERFLGGTPAEGTDS